MGLMARLERRNTRSARQRDRSSLLNMEDITFLVNTSKLSRFPTSPSEAVMIVATPEHQNMKVFRKQKKYK